MSRTDSTLGTDIRATQPGERRRHIADCRCGQQLDVCARAHCPRCGRSITAS